ncbi:Unhealthy ribosome biogenesis protein 2 like protein [Argiope bruennichi]|uniref:Unhealthy ribosome biogenesis protein 2 like protein n=1 Tax=Argiope bruennichi TaxID=94029 RepID=A0A8T0FTD7_ARGBR|nr:Unhealthy ribosome biogenesis protein 2 like protein [Argiope bruennichi]
MPESTVKMTSNKLANDENRSKLMKKVKDISNLLAYMDDDSKVPFISNSLTEIATLVYLASSDKDCSELSEKLIVQICSIVFNFKTKPYDSFLTVNDDAENSEFPNWALLEFFQKMHALLQTSDYVFGTVPGTKACAAFMKRIIFEIFKEKRSDMEPLKILSLFCAMSGVDIPLLVTANSCCDKIFKDAGKKPDINIMSLNYILEGCCGCSHYFNLTTVPDGLLAPSDWLEGLMFVLLDVHHEKNQSTWLKCFRSLLKMSLSVVEKHLTTIIKSTLLKINMDDADSKKDYCDLFIDLISLYSRLHQLPKFFVKLLLALTECIQEGSLGEYICKGQIFPVVLNSVALHSQELPFGQIMEQWKIFSETYTTFGNMTQVFTKGKGAVFFVSQLFATFLMHCKLFDFTVPDAIYEKFGDLILHTRKELKKNISILSDRSKELIECLPLEYLLPGNQVKCIVGLSVLFFLTPESCNSHEARNVAEKIAKLLIAIFDAVRSIWFFDFVNSGFYLREVVNTLERLMTMKAIDETSEWPKLLLHSLVRLILKRRESLIAMENFFSELNVVEETAEFSCLVLLLTLEQVSQIFKKVHLPDDYKESCENLASSLCSSCVKAVKKTEEGYSVSVYCTLIECYAEVIKILTSTSCNIDQKKKERYLKPLPKIITIAKENISNPKNNAYFKFFASICEHSKDIESFIPDDFHLIIWSNVHILFQQQCLNPTALQQSQNILHPVTLQNNEIKLLNSLFTLMSKEDTDKILEELLKQMENIDLVFLNAFTLQMNLNIIKQIIDSDSKRPESSLPTTILVNILSQLCRISLNKSSDTDFHIHMIKIPILQFINFLLKLKKSCIPRQHLVQSLSACRVSKFPKDSNSFSLFLNEFDAVFDVCYSLLVYHSEVVFNATFSFLQTVILLLRSLIAAGSQDHIAKQEKTVHLQIFQAAQNMDRLFTVMSRHKTNFAKLASYLIAEYVDCVQHITLDGNVKDHLLSGMYRLLDLCSEDTLKSVSVNINHSCRDIFINVMKNYKQLKYRGDV